MRSAFAKDLLRSVTHSLGRFLAIAVMAALGTGFFAGLQMTGPDMRLAADRYFDGTALYDVRVVSTMGLSEDSVEGLARIEGVGEVMPSIETDALATVGTTQCAVRIHALDTAAASGSTSPDGVVVDSSDDAYLNRPILREGRWPESADECVVSADAVIDEPVEIGTSVRVLEGATDLEGVLDVREFTVVGLVSSSNYACFTNLGSTSLGNGSIDQYLFVPDDSFSPDCPYTEAFLSVDGAAEMDASSEEYSQTVAAVLARIESAVPDLEAERFEEIRTEASERLEEGDAELEEARAEANRQLADATADLDEAESRLADTAAQLDAAQAELDQGLARMASSENELQSGEAEWRAGAAELESRKKEAVASFEEQQSLLDGQRAEVEASMAGLDAMRSELAAVEEELASLDPSSPEYAEKLAQRDAIAAGIERTLASFEQLDRAQAALDAARGQAEAELSSAQATLDASRARLDEGWSALDAARTEAAAGERELEEGRRLYEKGRAEYETGRGELEAKRAEAEGELAEAERELEEAREEVESLERPEFLVLDRTKNVGVESFWSDSRRMDSIAQVFPAIFFLVAALVSLTTMTRMVDEQRILIGTYKALGYGKGRIAFKYLSYAFVASGVGSAIGIVAFSQFLPWFIQDAYGVTYAVPVGATPIDLGVAVFSAGLGVGTTLLATAAAAFSSLKENPASLMLPRAPKAGKRILLERIGPLWRRMSFSWKVTARNIFRYKRRFFMAVIGIAGCTALLLTGLGLQNAINDIIAKQFDEVYDYSMTVRLDDAASKEDASSVEEALSEGEVVTSFTRVASSNVIATSDADREGQRIELIVPESVEEIEGFVSFKERESGESIPLDEGSVVISEKLSSHLGVHVGDSIWMQGEDAVGNAAGESHELTVTAVMENYVGQYAFVGARSYAEAFGEEPVFGAYYAKAVEDDEARQLLSSQLLSMDGVKTVGYNDETISMYRTMLKSVDSVVVILVVAAAVLAFVVLYNLNNINITERQREVATLKVLGFTPREVDAYIYRETALLSMIGAAFGLLLGVFMERYVVLTVEVDQVMFGRDIHALSFVIAYVLTMVFTGVVMLAMRRKLRHIDMVESLKSVE